MKSQFKLVQTYCSIFKPKGLYCNGEYEIKSTNFCLKGKLNYDSHHKDKCDKC